jgi:hypothetical protein
MSAEMGAGATAMALQWAPCRAALLRPVRAKVPHGCIFDLQILP